MYLYALRYPYIPFTGTLVGYLAFMVFTIWQVPGEAIQVAVSVGSRA